MSSHFRSASLTLFNRDFCKEITDKNLFEICFVYKTLGFLKMIDLRKL